MEPPLHVYNVERRISMGAIDYAGLRITYGESGIITPLVDDQRLTGSKALAYPAHITTRRPTRQRVQTARGK